MKPYFKALPDITMSRLKCGCLRLLLAFLVRHLGIKVQGQLAAVQLHYVVITKDGEHNIYI